jgi:hypothetical protein
VTRKSVIPALLIAAFLLVEALAARTLAHGDPIEAVIARDAWVILLALVALAMRLFLVLLAPGWLLYLALALLRKRAR